MTLAQDFAQRLRIAVRLVLCGVEQGHLALARQRPQFVDPLRRFGRSELYAIARLKLPQRSGR